MNRSRVATAAGPQGGHGSSLSSAAAAAPPRSLWRWAKFAAGFAFGVGLAFVVQALVSGVWVGGMRAAPELPPWHLEDIDAESVDVGSQCAVQPQPKQIVYNRIGKAGSMSVSQAIINAHRTDGFAWRNLDTGEFGSPQRFLELVQQYVGAGLGCVEKAPPKPAAAAVGALRGEAAEPEGELVFDDDGEKKGERAAGGAPSHSLHQRPLPGPRADEAPVVVSGTCPKTLFIGHVFYFDLADYLDGDDPQHGAAFTRPAYVNFLRDPVARYISQYDFWRTLSDIGPSVKSYGATLRQCVTNKDARHLFGCPPLNYMTSYLCGASPHCKDPPDEQTFLRAKRNLVKEYALVGITEYMDESLELFSRLFPDWFNPLPLRQTVLNRTPKKQKYGSLTMARVEAAHKYDRALYDTAMILFKKRLAACGLRLRSEDDAEEGA